VDGVPFGIDAVPANELGGYYRSELVAVLVAAVSGPLNARGIAADGAEVGEPGPDPVSGVNARFSIGVGQGLGQDFPGLLVTHVLLARLAGPALLWSQKSEAGQGDKQQDKQAQSAGFFHPLSSF
jgi:hypothetical protein